MLNSNINQLFSNIRLCLRALVIKNPCRFNPQGYFTQFKIIHFNRHSNPCYLQRNNKLATLIGFAFNPDAATKSFDLCFGHEQANTFAIVAGMENLI